MPGGEEGAEHRAAHPHREQRREQRGADGAVGGFAQADDAARGQQLRVASRERAGDRREAPDQRHQEDALDAAPAVGEQRQRNGAERDGDRDDRDERAELAVRQVPLRLEVREHRHDDLAVDVVDDHQREQDREHRPRVAARRRALVRGVVRRRGESRMPSVVMLAPSAELSVAAIARRSICALRCDALCRIERCCRLIRR